MSTGSNPSNADLIKQLRGNLSRDKLIQEAQISNYTISKYDRKIVTELGNEIIKLRNENKSMGEIAKILGCSKSTVSAYCHYIDPDRNLVQELTEKRIIKDKASVLLHNEAKWLRKAIKTSKYTGTFNYQTVNLLRYRIIAHYNNTCMKCNMQFSNLSFHHVDPTTKLFNINSKTRKTEHELIQEANKCSLLCHNCHDEVHKFKISDLPIVNVSMDILDKVMVNSIVIKEIKREQLDFFCKSLHYLRNSNKGSIYNLGFFSGDDLIAVALITNVVRKETAIQSEPTCELSRFLIIGRHRTQNIASKCLSILIKFLRINSKYKWLVSFADTEYHLGTIYKASNWMEVGKTKPSYNYDGIHKKTIYERAKKLGMSEYDYARFFNLNRCKEQPKIKFAYNLRTRKCSTS